MNNISNGTSVSSHLFDVTDLEIANLTLSERMAKMKEKVNYNYYKNHSFVSMKNAGKDLCQLINYLCAEVKYNVEQHMSDNDTYNECFLEAQYNAFQDILNEHFEEKFLNDMPKMIKSRGLVKNHKANFDKYFDESFVKRRFFNYLNEMKFYTEQKAKNIGGSGKLAQKYASEESMQIRKEQTEATDDYLKSVKLTNGKTAYDMKKTDKTKLIELYLTSKAFQDIAKEKGFKWLFITLTLPSEFHCNPKKGKNSWDGSTVRDGNEHLKAQMNLLRKKIKEDEMQFGLDNGFGLRVAEPQQDGTIHYHIVLFASEKNFDYYKSVFRTYFEREVIVKQGFKDVAIKQGCVIIEEGYDRDGNKLNENNVASAASYIIKYCLKNSDLNDLDKANNKFTEIDAVNAWKSANRIRSFSTLGIKSAKTKYDDCRRIANYLNKGKDTKTREIRFLNLSTKRYLSDIAITKTVNENGRECVFYDFKAAKKMRKSFLDSKDMYKLIGFASDKKDGQSQMDKFILKANELEYIKDIKLNKRKEEVKVNTDISFNRACVNLDEIKTIRVIK